MKLKRIVSCMMTLLLILGLPVTALAAEYDLAEGSVTVTATESGQTVTHGSNAAVPDDAPVIIQSNSEAPTANTVTVKADAGATANVTLDGVNIDTSTSGGAAIQTSGGGDVVIELDGTNKVQSGRDHAGVEKTNGGDLTITNTDEITADDPGSLEATGGRSGAGIGAGYANHSGNIVVSGNAQVKAQGGESYFDPRYTASYGAGAAIGNGGGGALTNLDVSASLTGKEADVTVYAPGESVGFVLYVGQLDQGWIAKYQPGADLDTDTPSSLTFQGKDGNITTSTDVQLATDKAPTCTEDGHKAGFSVDGELVAVMIPAKGHSFTNYISNPDATYDHDGTKTATCDFCDATDTIPDPGSKLVRAAAPLYRVVDQDGKALACKAEQKDGVLTVTAEADFAALTGTLGGVRTLQARGVDTIVFVTNGAVSTFALSDLLAQGGAGDTYTLTHDGAAVTFTMTDGADVSKILQ